MAILQTRAKPLGIELVVKTIQDDDFSDCFAVLMPSDLQVGMLCAAFTELLCTLHIQNWCTMHHRNDCVRCNNLQNITQKTKDRATRTPLKTGVT
jgi:hypothetical protein